MRRLKIETGEAQPEEVELRSRLAMGQVARAMKEDLLEASQYREELIGLISVVSFKRMDQVFQWTKTRARQADHIQPILDELSSILRDVALIKTGRETSALINKDLRRQLEVLALQKSIPALLAMFEAVQNTKVALKANANTQLALENMFINFCEAA